MKKVVAGFVVILLLFGFCAFFVSETIFYSGMTAYCRYIPYYYENGTAVFLDDISCAEVVNDARKQDLYNNRREIYGPLDSTPYPTPTKKSGADG